MVQINHANGGESVQSNFWQQIAEKIRATERGGHYHADIEGELVSLCDCRTGEIAQMPAMGLVVELSQKSKSGDSGQASQGDIMGVSVGQCALSAKVAHVEQEGVIRTVWLTEPELIDTTSTWDMAGEPTKEDLEYLGA